MFNLTLAEITKMTANLQMNMGIRYGTIVNIDDPMGLGRLKVHIPSVEAEAFTDWAFYLRPYSSESSGFWHIPQTGSKVICGFISNIPEQPVIIAFLYTKDNLPPIEQDDENNYKMITTPAGTRIQFLDKEGEENITIVSHDGSMKIEINDESGILIDNPEGDTTISCKAFRLESPESGSLNFDKKLILEADEEILLESEKALTLTSSKDLVFKSGEKIKLSGSGGVLAKCKPLAAKEDMVIGIDIHKEVVPVGSGTVDVPFPNLFMGKLADKLSDNVLLENRGLAVKGSIAKHETGHILWPPGIKFCEQPKDEGEVVDGTEPSVLINGKEAAVLLSKTENCTDMNIAMIGTGFVLTKGVSMLSILKDILFTVDWGALQDLLAAVGVSLGDVLDMICGMLGTSLDKTICSTILESRLDLNIVVEDNRGKAVKNADFIITDTTDEVIEVSTGTLGKVEVHNLEPGIYIIKLKDNSKVNTIFKEFSTEIDEEKDLITIHSTTKNIINNGVTMQAGNKYKLILKPIKFIISF